VTDTLLPDALVDKAREVVDANRSAGRRIAIAESCTGGLVSAALTEIPGSSDVFEAGYVTYSNAAKISQLKVSEEVVETFGAVSVATAWAMARGALAASEADVAVAITGVAGPGGGTAQKPVGTVVFARAERGAVIDHVDCTIIAEEPRIGPYRDSMRSRVAEILGLGVTQVSIKATTTEGLGFAGRREGVAAQSVASIRMLPDA
jgi:nicotinamide-nucleotide amidase